MVLKIKKFLFTVYYIPYAFLVERALTKHSVKPKMLIINFLRLKMIDKIIGYLIRLCSLPIVLAIGM